MSAEPTPLPIGTVLADRFELLDVLGRGGYGIAYLAQDLVREDHVVIKELAPYGVHRSREGLLDLDGDPQRSAHLLRQRFQQEAQLMRKVRSSGVPNLRTTFTENGTSYAVTDYVEGAETLARLMQREGRLGEEAVREILLSMLDILEKVHAVGILHRDIKPSNILLLPRGALMLIDFGSARDYAESTQTVMYSPGYAPPEQLSERATRGPATDFYALGATIYHALVGFAPVTANDRLAGIPLDPLAELRRDVDPVLAASIEAAMALKMAERPQSVAEWRQLLSKEEEPEAILDLESLEDMLVRARELRFDRRGCPACNGVLEDVRPLRRLACPVCREGTVRMRDLDEDLCPQCGEGRIRTWTNRDPLCICPTCCEGVLQIRRKGLLNRDQVATCSKCPVTYEIRDGIWTSSEGRSMPAAEWREESGRPEQVRICEHCHAQLDHQPDGRWQMVVPQRDSVPLYLDEWARVAAGFAPGVGNAVCDACQADYWLEPNRLTLLDADKDPFQFAEDYLGRSLQIEDVRWLGVGKSSGRTGSVCDRCGTELDREGDEFRLVRSPNRRLSRDAGETHSLGDWHRIAAGLPTVAEEPQFCERIDELLREAYREGSLPFDSGSPTVHWRGRARRLSDGQEAQLTITETDLRFGGPLRRWKVSVGEWGDAMGADSELMIAGETFEIELVELSADLRSGNHQITISAADISARIASAAKTLATSGAEGE